MNKLFFSAVFFIISCTSNIVKEQQVALNAEVLQQDSIIVSEPYRIYDEYYDFLITIEEKDGAYNLIFAIDLKNDAYYISPNEEKEFSGKFFYDLGTKDKITFKGDIIETPIAISKKDKFNSASVKWIRKNTVYTQPLNLLSKDDFEVYGRVIFTIEPRCTLENIPYIIIFKDGKMIIKESKC